MDFVPRQKRVDRGSGTKPHTANSVVDKYPLPASSCDILPCSRLPAAPGSSASQHNKIAVHHYYIPYNIAYSPK